MTRGTVKRLSLLKLAFSPHLDDVLRDVMADALRAAQTPEPPPYDYDKHTNLRLELLRSPEAMIRQRY